MNPRRAFLFAAEYAYLRLSGWRRTGHDAWDPPSRLEKFPGEGDLRHGHAVNRQKYADQTGWRA